MTRIEAIELAIKIEKEPTLDIDYSACLYNAVGLIKREPGTATSMVAHRLVKAIENTGAPLSDFSKRKIRIIEETYTNDMCHDLDRFARALENCAYDAHRRFGEI